MPTVYVKVKFELTTTRNNWAKAKKDEKDLWRETAVNPSGYRLVFRLNSTSNDGSFMRPDSGYFAPYDMFMSELDERTGTLSTVFDGTIKLPISAESEAALKSWPKTKQSMIYVEVSDIYNDASFDHVAVPFPCSISKSKPKAVNFE